MNAARARHKAAHPDAMRSYKARYNAKNRERINAEKRARYASREAGPAMTVDPPILAIPDVTGLSRGDAAGAYAAAGWPVGPLWWAEDGGCGCGKPHADKSIGKHPIDIDTGLAPHGLKDFTTNAAVVAGWWRRYPNANVGLLPPPGYFGLDIDDPEAEGERATRPPEAGPLQFTGSGSGRCQLVYRLDGLPRDGIAFNRPMAGRGAETKGDGLGYLVPPSVTRGPYRWARTGAVPTVPDDVYQVLPRQAERPPAGPMTVGDCQGCATPASIPRDPGGYAWPGPGGSPVGDARPAGGRASGRPPDVPTADDPAVPAGCG